MKVEIRIAKFRLCDDKERAVDTYMHRIQDSEFRNEKLIFVVVVVAAARIQMKISLLRKELTEI